MDQSTQPETPQPVAPSAQPSSSNMYKTLAIILGVVIVLLVGAGAFLFMNSNKDTKEMTQLTTVTPTTAMQQDGVTPTAMQSVITPTTNEATVIIIESEGNLPQQDISELRARVINPYVDYFKETHTEDQLATFKVSVNTQASKTTYPYLADAITKKGVNEGFVIEKADGHITWWIPECMNGCNFSDSFKAKYPEVIKAYGN